MFQLPFKIVIADRLNLQIVLFRLNLDLEWQVHLNESKGPLCMLNHGRAGASALQRRGPRGVSDLSQLTVNGSQQNTNFCKILQVGDHALSCFLLHQVLLGLDVAIAIEEFAVLEHESVQHAVPGEPVRPLHLLVFKLVVRSIFQECSIDVLRDMPLHDLVNLVGCLMLHWFEVALIHERNQWLLLTILLLHGRRVPQLPLDHEDNRFDEQIDPDLLQGPYESKGRKGDPRPEVKVADLGVGGEQLVEAEAYGVYQEGYDRGEDRSHYDLVLYESADRHAFKKS